VVKGFAVAVGFAVAWLVSVFSAVLRALDLDFAFAFAFQPTRFLRAASVSPAYPPWRVPPWWSFAVGFAFKEPSTKGFR
jgi:hypothetical protein